MSHPCIKQAQVFVYFRRSTYGRTWVAAVHLLFDGDGRRYALDVVTFRLAHASQKLTGVAAEAFYVATLPLGIEGIKRQRRLARATQSGDDNQLVAGYLHVNVLQVIDAGPFY